MIKLDKKALSLIVIISAILITLALLICGLMQNNILYVTFSTIIVIVLIAKEKKKLKIKFFDLEVELEE